MGGLNLNNCSHAFRNIILNKKHNLDYTYTMVPGDSSTHTVPGLHYEPSLAVPNVPFLTDYHPKLLDYTLGLDVWGATDGYSGNVRRGNYANQWDKRGNVVNVAEPHRQIEQPTNDIREQWDDPIRNEYNSYLDYTNAIFMRDSDPKNILAGIMTGDGIGLSTYGGNVSVVSNFNIQQSLAGRIYSTTTGRDTRLGKIGMKAAAISMANNILNKTSRMAGGFFKEGIQYLLHKITRGRIGDDQFEMAKYASPSITDRPGGGDNFMSATGLGSVINAGVGGLGISELLSNDNWTKTATSGNDGKYVRIDVNGVLVEYIENTRPDFNIFLSGNQRLVGKEKVTGQDVSFDENGEPIIENYDYFKDVFNSESEYRRLQQTELINWSGVLTKEQIFQNLSRNKYQPGYTISERFKKKLDYHVYGTTEENPLQLGLDKNRGILEASVSGLRVRNKRQIYTWTENVPGSKDINDSDYNHADGVYHGIDQTNIGNIDVEFIGDIYKEDTLLEKTRRLFKAGKINTIVSSFYREDSPSEIQTSVSKWGISKGRNLLNKGSQGGRTPNGYIDPYCRVWTWERQYRNIQNAIRPFLITTDPGDPGNVGDPVKLGDLHKRIEFARPNLEVFARFTSLQDNGLPKIAPYKSDYVTYDSSGRVKSGWKGLPEDRRKYNRNFFFSIENLAWKDLKLEDILCPSQVGPNGGRIYWFSPLNLDFDETTSVSLNKESFIGRGEQVITYIDSIRTGNLSFTMVVDHSSFTEYMKQREFNDADEDYHGILLWDAGCDDPSGIEFNNIYRGTVGGGGDGTGDPCEGGTGGPNCPPDIEQEESIEEPKQPVRTPREPEKGERGTGKTETKLVTRVYYPNDYSGVDESSAVSAMNYLYSGGINGTGYEMDGQITLSGVNTSDLTMTNGSFVVENIKCNQKDAYIKEKKLFSVFASNITKTDFLFREGRKRNYLTSQSAVENLKRTNPDPRESEFRDKLPRMKYYSHMSYWDVENHNLNVNKPPEADSISFKEFYDKCMSRDPELIKLLEDAQEVIITGNASSHGYGATDNQTLALNRAETMLEFIKVTLGVDTSDNKKWKCTSDNANVSVEGSTCSSSISAKKGRFAKVEIKKEITEEYIINQAEIDKDEEEFQAEMDEYQRAKIARDREIEAREMERQASERARQAEMERQASTKKVVLKGRYDEEMEYYNYVDKSIDLTFSNVKDKYNHYIPCFWSLTPEGFNGRLTFLNQCTRQGPTMSGTDSKQSNSIEVRDNNDNITRKKGQNATNLSFGRPPVCILKIGDFIQSRIYIESLSIDYKNGGNIQWDLNPEGIGIQPMMANVRISFIYMGGQDISGAIAQLQNAITFNYYANTSVYDDRAASNGMEGEQPEHLFDPDTYQNGNDYKAYLGTDRDYIPPEFMKPLDAPPITKLTVEPKKIDMDQETQRLKDYMSRQMNPISVKNTTGENNPFVAQDTTLYRENQYNNNIT